jgi:O-succinylbenzoic acid--CoA ligase
VTPDPVRYHALARPDAPAVATEAGVWTWADLDARVSACAARLSVLPGRRPVAVVAPTSPDLVVVLLAALRAGVVVAPLSPRWPAAMVEESLARLGADVFIGDAGGALGVQTVRLDEVTAPGPAGDTRALDTRALDEARPWTVVHTSGSSGEPKAALHTVGNHIASAHGVSARLGLEAGDCWLLDLPLWHVGGLSVVVRCVLAGAAMAIPDAGTSTADALRRFTPTHASLVSTQLFRLLRDDPAAGASLRAVLLGGSAVAPSLLDAAHAAGLPVCVGYGMTETTSTVTMTAPGESRDALGTAGRVLPGRELRVSLAGEIEVRGATLFAGYLGADGLDRPLTSDGWFATGDVGRFDAAGRLVVAGRLGTRFVSGGENVQPEAVEAALAALPGVAEAVVVAVPDAEWGERGVAFVRPSGAVLPDAAILCAALRKTLPAFAVPAAIYPWEGAVGLKPDRRALAAEAERLAGIASV